MGQLWTQPSAVPPELLDLRRRAKMEMDNEQRPMTLANSCVATIVDKYDVFAERDFDFTSLPATLVQRVWDAVHNHHQKHRLKIEPFLKLLRKLVQTGAVKTVNWQYIWLGDNRTANLTQLLRLISTRCPNLQELQIGASTPSLNNDEVLHWERLQYLRVVRIPYQSGILFAMVHFKNIRVLECGFKMTNWSIQLERIGEFLQLQKLSLYVLSEEDYFDVDAELMRGLARLVMSLPELWCFDCPRLMGIKTDSICPFLDAAVPILELSPKNILIENVMLDFDDDNLQFDWPACFKIQNLVLQGHASEADLLRLRDIDPKPLKSLEIRALPASNALYHLLHMIAGNVTEISIHAENGFMEPWNLFKILKAAPNVIRFYIYGKIKIVMPTSPQLDTINFKMFEGFEIDCGQDFVNVAPWYEAVLVHSEYLSRLVINNPHHMTLTHSLLKEHPSICTRVVTLEITIKEEQHFETGVQIATLIALRSPFLRYIYWNLSNDTLAAKYEMLMRTQFKHFTALIRELEIHCWHIGSTPPPRSWFNWFS